MPRKAEIVLRNDIVEGRLFYRPTGTDCQCGESHCRPNCIDFPCHRATATRSGVKYRSPNIRNICHSPLKRRRLRGIIYSDVPGLAPRPQGNKHDKDLKKLRLPIQKSFRIARRSTRDEFRHERMRTVRLGTTGKPGGRFKVISHGIHQFSPKKDRLSSMPSSL
jgi:hypothetical protein